MQNNERDFKPGRPSNFIPRVRAVPSPLDSLHPKSRDDVGFHVRNSRSKNAVPVSRDKEVAIKTNQHGAALQLN
jgi:hypothetical protein